MENLSKKQLPACCKFKIYLKSMNPWKFRLKIIRQSNTYCMNAWYPRVGDEQGCWVKLSVAHLVTWPALLCPGRGTMGGGRASSPELARAGTQGIWDTGSARTLLRDTTLLSPNTFVHTLRKSNINHKIKTFSCMQSCSLFKSTS